MVYSLLSSAVMMESFREKLFLTTKQGTRQFLRGWSRNYPQILSTSGHLHIQQSLSFSSTTNKTITSSPSNIININNKIAIAMSGGVDSSVVASLLSQQYPPNQLLGIHMSNWEYHDDDNDDNLTTTKKSKCWEEDWKDAQAVARHLHLDLKHVSFQKDYWNYVFEPYCNQVSNNKNKSNNATTTPNPDVACNRWIKFGVLKDYLYNRYGIQRLATGHYARLWDRSTITTPDLFDQSMPSCLETVAWSASLEEYLMQPSVRQLPVLLAAKDGSKDQSYFLCNVPAAAFANVMFPLGDYYKNRLESPPQQDVYHHLSTHDMVTVRELARHAKLPNASKKDSMGICFVGKRNHGAFLNKYISPTFSSGMLLQCINIEDGSIVATVDTQQNPSLLYATIGQGAKLSGATQKWFVMDKKYTNDHKVPLSLILCPGTNHPSLYSDTLFLDSTEFHWIMGGIPPPMPFQAKCRIRHMQPLVDCEIDVFGSSRKEGHPNTTNRNRRRYIVHLATPLRGIARGQICALYAGGGLICLGGGPIDQRGPSYWELQRDLPPRFHPAGHNDMSTSSNPTEIESDPTENQMNT
jgi:tRNA-5-taurinomethyluridine 2-sulfurtransferase